MKTSEQKAKEFCDEIFSKSTCRDRDMVENCIKVLLEDHALAEREDIVQYIIDQGKLSVSRTGTEVYFITDDDIEIIRSRGNKNI